jgi:hypothetical protein
VSELSDLLALCGAMGLEVVSLRRLPCQPDSDPGATAVNGAGVRGGPGSSAGSAGDPDGRIDPVEEV